MQLTLEQQFEYNKMVTDAQKLPPDQAFTILLTAYALLMRKNNIIKDMTEQLENPQPYNISESVFTLTLEQQFSLEEFKRTNSNNPIEKTIELLLETMKELMIRDNLIRDLIMRV